jgi:hypothetical protein
MTDSRRNYTHLIVNHLDRYVHTNELRTSGRCSSAALAVLTLLWSLFICSVM